MIGSLITKEALKAGLLSFVSFSSSSSATTYSPLSSLESLAASSLSCLINSSAFVTPKVLSVTESGTSPISKSSPPSA